MKSLYLALLLATLASPGHCAVSSASHAGEAQPAFEAPATLPGGPLQGSAAMRGLLRQQSQELEALAAQGGQGSEEALAALKARQDLERLDLLATEAEKEGRLEEAARARSEAARLRAPAPTKPLRFVKRVAPDASVPMGAATPAQEDVR
jgi:hypothetical protein